MESIANTSEHSEMPAGGPLIVGLGGTTRVGSSCEQALKITLDAAEAAGARTRGFFGPDLVLPAYAPENPERDAKATDLVEALRAADGIVIASPGYHGSISGVVKNALDYTEDMRDDAQPYFDGRAVGCIVCAAGWPAGGSTLAALRSVVHALRGWPTPMAAMLNTATTLFDAHGRCLNEKYRAQLELVGSQVVEFAHMRAATTPAVSWLRPRPGHRAIHATRSC